MENMLLVPQSRRESVLKPGDLEGILAAVRRVVAEVIAPDAEAVDAEARWPERGMRALLDAGLGGLVVPRESGGLGGGLFALASVCEEIGKSCTSTALCFGMHCVGTAVIAAKPTEHQKKTYLEPIARGEHLTTLALSEPGSGSHFYFPQTRLAHEAGGSLRVDGGKSFVTNGGHVDSYVVSTVTQEDGPIGEFSCVVLPEGTPGMTWGPPWAGLGMRGNSSRQLTLEGVRLPNENLLGRPGDQIWYIFQVVAPYFLMAMAGSYLGVASAAVEEAMAHLKKRHYDHSGAHLSEIAVLQHRVGTLYGQIERTRQLVYHAGRDADAGGAQGLALVCTAKAEVADCATAVTNEAMTLMGGIAYREHGKMGRLLRDARASHVMAPTTDILRTWAGRAMLGQPLLG